MIEPDRGSRPETAETQSEKAQGRDVMKLNTKTLLATSLALGLSIPVLAGGPGAGNHLVLNVIGTGYQYPGMVPDLDGDGLCDKGDPDDDGDNVPTGTDSTETRLRKS